MALRVPKNSPLRRTRSFFWGVHANDQGVGFRNEFHAMVNKGAIELVAPSRATGFGNDGRSVMLDDGRLLNADAVVVATGYSSSWTKIFDSEYFFRVNVNLLSSKPISFRRMDNGRDWVEQA